MKLSLSWLFDHIDADWQTIDVARLINLFNKTTAEIEGFDTVTVDLPSLSAARVHAVEGEKVTLEVPELKKQITLTSREGLATNQIYLIVTKNKHYEWARLADLGSEKEGLLPAMHIAQPDLEGAWKKQIVARDVILHLDNKSINHRPDMWGHRGVAREIAAMLQLPFKSLDHLLIDHDAKESGKSKSGFTIAIENQTACRRFSALHIEKVNALPTTPWMAARLARVDSRPINGVVDATNYVMLDLGQPMHAFDGASFSDKTLVVRMAKNKESLTVLDGQTLELTADDCVITNGKHPVALAGIMGGKASGVGTATESLVIEAANFDPAMIRKTSARVKKRTESSARFEKSLDPVQTVVAIRRLLKILADTEIATKISDAIISLGTLPAVTHLDVSHQFIERQLGVVLDSAFITRILEKLGFAVTEKKGNYHITIPSFRATKDVAIKQDIVEEIGRFYGYDAIPEQLPARITKPFDLTAVNRMRAIKQLCATAWQMQEVYTYAFFDESFLQTIDWQPGTTLKVQEAVSQNWQRLVTTLIPNMLKVVQVHAADYDEMNFFEWAKMWPEGTAESERSSLVGIFVDQKKPVDFYAVKEKMSGLARMLDIQFDWVQAPADDTLPPWYMPYQTANLMYEGQKIGIAGKVNQTLFTRIATGDAFIFELDGEFLLVHHKAIKRYKAASRYPAVTRDVSMLIPLRITVKELADSLQAVDAHITQVTLIDFFEKKEWQDQKSVTFRITMIDPHATMTSEQADTIMNKVIEQLHGFGAVIR